MRRFACFLGVLLAASAAGESRGVDAPGGEPAPRPQLYVVGTSHLDTQWRWTIQKTIDEYIPATMRDNLALIEKYPDYVFSFEGAFRYMLMREYYPDDYARVKKAIADGRWRVAGSWVDAVDTNMPSPESLIRQALYGNGFFRREFGTTSCDIFLPDCFGFGYALPSIANHCGITGFSTQKLTWGSAVGVPFDIGIWEGVDGSELVASINPGEYVSRIKNDLSADSSVVATVMKQGTESGLYAGFKYFGTGDEGGAPTEESVQWLEKSIHGTGPVRVRSVASDQIARDVMELSAAARDRLPHYKGELLMTDHGTGCYTSQAAMKRFNRKNERLADAAERASVVAGWLGSSPYPGEALRENWIRFLWHQFHDDLTGTSIPEAYVYSWNDEAIALNRSSSILNSAVGGVSRALDTNAKGVPIVVYNPLGIAREDAVDADVIFDGAPPRSARVWGPDGREVPSQVRAAGKGLHVTFLASAPPVGFVVYDVRPADTPCDMQTGLSATETTLENARYRLRINADGDIASVFDKKANREAIASPIRLEMINDQPYDWAAWEVDYDDIMAPPRALVGAPPKIAIVENGPARCALEIHRSAGGSTFRQTVRLVAGGAEDRIEIENDVDWGSKGTLLKAAFPLTVANEKATYDLGLGTIERGTNRKELYEVPAQQWADLTGADGAYGVAIMNDCKYGWDKPDDHTLRLTLLRTPEVNDRWSWIKDQRSMDLGRHRFTFAISGHLGDWRAGGVPLQADRLNQPLIAYQTTRHPGSLGRSFSLVYVSSPAVAVRAVKMAEDSDEIVVRLQELHGREARAVRIEFGRPILNAREVNGAEDAVGPALVVNGGIYSTFGPYQPRTFALRLDAPPTRLDPPEARGINLPFNMDGATVHGASTTTPFDEAGHSLPGELLPARLLCGAIPFTMGTAGSANVLACRGQKIPIPGGTYDHLYMIAAAVGGDRRASFRIDDRPTDLWIQDYAEPIGQWDSRLATGRFREERSEILPAYTKPDPIAWVGSHRHAKDGKAEAHAFAQAFQYALAIDSGARMLTLPDDERIRIFAITAARDPNAATFPAQRLLDPPGGTGVRIIPESPDFLKSTRVSMSSPNAGATMRYTLDGSDPTPASTVYKEPIRISKPTTVKARAYCEGLDPTFVASVTLNKLTPRKATPVSDPMPGLACRYYEDAWSKVPNFRALTPVRTDVVDRVVRPTFAREENFGLLLNGYLKVPQDGLYILHLWSDDGSVLRLGDAPMIDNDGLHGRGEVSASYALKAGYHPVEIAFFQKLGDQALELWIEGPDLPLQQIPTEMLAHTEADR